ncbi:MAG: transposase [Verrucomicrobiota bacterium]
MNTSYQVEMISLEELVPCGHVYRKFLKLLDLKSIGYRLKRLESQRGAKGYGMETLFRCLLLQFIEDLSDRELEKMIQENTAAKLFCEFSLKDTTPDHTVFTRARKRIGTKELSKMFAKMRDQLRAKGYMNEVFNFVDASHLVSKAALWEERDEAIRQRYEKLNNQTVAKVASDKQARFGCKGKTKFWYGYKEHVSMDMQSGLINKIAITAANVTDAKGLKHIRPKRGAVYGDKGYCIKPAREVMEKYGLHDATVKLNHMKVKDRHKDRWLSGIRSPYERVFSGRDRRVKYKGIEKNQFKAFGRAIAFNLKRLVKLQAHDEGLCLA